MGSVKISLSRLRQSIWDDNNRLERARSVRREVLDRMGGPMYGQGSSQIENPVNVLELGITTYATQLTPSEPRALITTWRPELRPSSTNLRLACNQVAKRIGLSQEIEESIINACVGLGIMKVGICRDPLADWRADYGMPFATSIGLDDWIHDTHVRKASECTYYGQRVTLTADEVMEHDEYDRQAKEQAWEQAKHSQTPRYDQPSVSSLSHGFSFTGERMYKTIDCWELYFPKERHWMLLPVEGDGKPLTVRRWTGHRDGPYRFLRLGVMPDNFLPIAPGVLWLERHKMINNVVRKLDHQARRQKTVWKYRDQGEAEDADRVAKSADGSIIYQSADGFKDNVVNIPGVDQTTFAYALQMLDRWEHDAGNISLLAGLSAQTDTVGQDSLLSQNAGARMDHLKRKVNVFIAQIFESIAYDILSDPALNMMVTYTDPASGLSIPLNVTPDTLGGTIEDYNFEVEPYSRSFQSPEERMNFLLMVYERIVMPAIAAGMVDQLSPLLSKIASLRNMPEVQQVFGDLIPMAPQGELNPIKPSVTARHEIRHSNPTPTAQGHSQNMQAMMMGGGQQAEQAAVYGGSR